MIIAIDGPAGSGKSTVARLIATRLNFKYIETGSMYRAVAWKAEQSGIDLGDQERIAEVARTITIEFHPGSDRQKVMVDGKDLTPVLQTETIGQSAAIVAANKSVREVMVEQQQKMGQNENVVMDGRDIGTVVFPKADKNSGGGNQAGPAAVACVLAFPRIVGIRRHVADHHDAHADGARRGGPFGDLLGDVFVVGIHRPYQPEPARVRGVDLDRVGGIEPVHRPRRDE